VSAAGKKHPEIGDDRSDLGELIRSTYVGSYVVFSELRTGLLKSFVSFAATATHLFFRLMDAKKLGSYLV
jgi:hypothetical protein